MDSTSGCDRLISRRRRHLDSMMSCQPSLAFGAALTPSQLCASMACLASLALGSHVLISRGDTEYRRFNRHCVSAIPTTEALVSSVRSAG